MLRARHRRTEPRRSRADDSSARPGIVIGRTARRRALRIWQRALLAGPALH